MAQITLNEGLAWLKSARETSRTSDGPFPPVSPIQPAQGTRSGPVRRLHVDYSEGPSALLVAVQASGAFDVRMGRLAVGDYLVDDEVLIERKTVGDFIASLLDGRLFPQVARLAHSQYRSLLLIEGPPPASMPNVHPHALEGALVSLAAMWRLPVLHSSDPEHSLRLLRFLADQAARQQRVLRRFDRKPKRLASRRLFLLQGLPGVGPALARRLLGHFGSVERVFTADTVQQTFVRWGSGVVELVDHDDIKGFRGNVVEVDLGERLDRREDMPTLAWSMPVDQHFTKRSVAQHCPIRRQALRQNLPSVCDEQHTGISESLPELPVVKSGH